MTTPLPGDRVAARKPPYEVIATHFRDRIQRGALRPGDSIPAPGQIAQTWRVAGRTADRAIQQLISEGVLSRAANGPVVAGAGRRDSLTVLLDGLRPASVDAVELTEITPEVADQLGVRAGSSLLILHFNAVP